MKLQAVAVLGVEVQKKPAQMVLVMMLTMSEPLQYLYGMFAKAGMNSLRMNQTATIDLGSPKVVLVLLYG